MKHLYKLLFAFLFLSHFAQAQVNLVPNPSFEDTVSCPYGPGNIDASVGWFSGSASTDYYHPCSNSMNNHVGVPDNGPGYQLPYDGEAYAGVITYIDFNPNYREYLGVQLSEPLQAGIEYFVSAYISRGDSTYGGEVFDCSTNNFGFKFTTTKYEAINFNPVPVDNFSHVYSEDIILDSINWIQISGSFIADSMYNYLYIGNFYDAANTNINSCTGTAYYYVDKICVSTSATTCDVISSTPAIQTRSSIRLYPNPATDVLSVANLQRATAYTIFAGNGQVKQQGQLPEIGAQISVAALPPGLYFLQLPEVGTFKFVVAR